MGKKTMGVAVPVPIQALSVVNKAPFAEAAREIARKRLAEGLINGGYERRGPNRERFISRAQYVSEFPPGQVPAGLPPEVDAVMVTEIEVRKVRG